MIDNYNCFSDEDRSKWWYYILSIGIRDSILGIMAGTFLGICFVFIPHRSHVSILSSTFVALSLFPLSAFNELEKRQLVSNNLLGAWLFDVHNSNC